MSPTSNLRSIDHTVNSLAQSQGALTRQEFAHCLEGETSREVSDREVDLIFEIFDPDRGKAVGGAWWVVRGAWCVVRGAWWVMGGEQTAREVSDREVDLIF